MCRYAERRGVVGSVKHYNPILGAAMVALGLADACEDMTRVEILSEYSITAFFTTPGNSISNGREPKGCLGRVFNSKLGSFALKKS